MKKTIECMFLVALLSACLSCTPVREQQTIDRQAWVTRHNPSLNHIDPQSPFTLGNGKFAFTADITGLQSFYDHYFEHGIPLETKAKWAWHQRANPRGYQLSDADESYRAYGGEVNFPSNMDSAAGQWLRKNPHDLPLFRASFSYKGNALKLSSIGNVEQRLDMWRAQLQSRFSLHQEPVRVSTVVAAERDIWSAKIYSPLLSEGLRVNIDLPRGYDLTVKNTPKIDWQHEDQHRSKIIRRDRNAVLIYRKVDNAEHYVLVQWAGAVDFEKLREHQYQISSRDGAELEFSVAVSATKPRLQDYQRHADIAEATANWWQSFWHSGAAVDFTGSRDKRAEELERRIVLSRYLMAVQSCAAMPPQETGLTSSSWYGKHHSEMTFWHVAHWILWGNPEYAERVLDWYVKQLPTAVELAQSRGLAGARWAKMVGPNNRESPGGNPLIIWNQPQPIHLAEMLYLRSKDPSILDKYADLVELSAQAMSSMLVYDPLSERYNLEPPIWIAQEIYDPIKTRNPTFELAYWRYGLQLAARWRERLKQPANTLWQQQIDRLAPLPIKDEKYVAIESIPNTFDELASRRDHPSMLAAFGLLSDPTVDPALMQNTLNAVLQSWDWQEKIWGWDYPMIAMTATRLQMPQVAVDTLLAKLTHNHYLNNGHVPQPGANLPVYLPANGALLTALAMMLAQCKSASEQSACGFPSDGQWKIISEGFKAYPD